MRKGAGLYYFANDHLGGTAIVMESADLLITRTRYYPYGSVWTQEGGTVPTDRLFTGQRQYGAKSGIYYYGARFYSADIGRFLSPDSLVPGAGDPQALNRYSYVANNPLLYTDPSGHCIPDITCAGQDDNENTDQIDNPPPGGGGGAGGGSELDPVCLGPYLPVPCTTPGPTPWWDSFESAPAPIDAVRSCKNYLGCAIAGNWDSGTCVPAFGTSMQPANQSGGSCTVSSSVSFWARVEGDVWAEGNGYKAEVRVQVCDFAATQLCSEPQYVVGTFARAYVNDTVVGTNNALDSPYNGPAGYFDYGGSLDVDLKPTEVEIGITIVDAGYRYFRYNLKSGHTEVGLVRGE